MLKCMEILIASRNTMIPPPPPPPPPTHTQNCQSQMISFPLHLPSPSPAMILRIASRLTSTMTWKENKLKISLSSLTYQKGANLSAMDLPLSLYLTMTHHVRMQCMYVVQRGFNGNTVETPLDLLLKHNVDINAKF